MNAEVPGDAGEYLLTLISFIQQDGVCYILNITIVECKI